MSCSGTLSDKTVVVGLNAALQKRFVLPPSTPLTPGSVHRASRVEEGLGGKGQDVAVSLSQLWPAPATRNLYLAQFVGSGPGGDAVMSLLTRMMGECGGAQGCARDALTVRVQSAMRTCTSIVGSGSTTELVEPSGVITKEEMDGLLGRVDSLTSLSREKNFGVAALCIMGSMPPGCPDDTYARLCEAVSGDRTCTLVDSVIGLKPLLATLEAKRKSAAYTGRAILKINASELCRLAGVTQSGGGEAEGVTVEELNQAVKNVLEKYGSDCLDFMAITDGRHAAHLVKIGGDIRIYRLGMVDLTIGDKDVVLYPIGAGDTVAAGTLAALSYLRDGASVSPLDGECKQSLAEYESALEANEDDKHMLTSFVFGLACGSASCLEQENSVFQTVKVKELMSSMSKPTLC